MGDITANFNRDDFRCRCGACLENVMRPCTKIEVVYAMQRLRDSLGTPLKITCGVRCISHNKAEGGSPQSRHLPQYADAVDIFNTQSDFSKLLAERAWQCGFTVVRPYEAHIHLDMRPGPKRLLAAGTE